MRYFLALLFLFSVAGLNAQVRPNNGLAESEPLYYALKHAEIYVSPEKKIKGTILIKGDKIVGVGPFVSIPNGAVERDFSGKTILPAFIELNAEIGLPKFQYVGQGDGPQLESSKKGAFYWNECIHPEVDANALYSADDKKNKELIEKGFGFALSHQHDGVARGTGAFVSLSGNDPLLQPKKAPGFFSFSKGSSRQTYPSSQMGAIALIRQALYDGEWYARNNAEKNVSLEALNNQREGLLFFETHEKWEILRAEKIAKEFELSTAYLGSGNEYQIADHLAELQKTIVLPLNFPDAYDVENPYVARQIPLSDLKHWEAAPANAAILARHKVPICLSSDGVEKSEDFWKNLRKAIQFGLSKEDALAALTTTPAALIGCDGLVGTIEEGKLASFIVYDKDPFEEEARIEHTWLLGKETLIVSPAKHKIKGAYNILVDDYKFPLEITEDGQDKYKGSVTYTVTSEKGVATEKKADVNVSLSENDITLQFNVHSNELDGNVSLRGKVSSKFGVFEGDGLLPNGKWVKWSAIKSVKSILMKKGDDEEGPSVPDTNVHIWYPHMAYGLDTVPAPRTLVIKNATLWTNEEAGIVKNGTVIVMDGKITFAGSGRHSTPSGAKVIDAEGKHVTSGIIDEHSHIAIWRGVNEGGQAISAEVSIGDVVNPDDINIYRQLAGGVTAAQLLHGSANPIGGQSALVKLKWGSTPDDMLIDNAPGFIKFALGENVKQSNWGDQNTVRFPQTRMGVEQVYYDGFHRALAYKKSWSDYRANPSLGEPRRDLELEVLAEILDSKRFITCHSYVQSEINMLMHVADSMGFKVNTFTHILEGYKVADKMAAHGVGGSTFSDWWAYKFEVNDAIPYNAKLMHDQGVVVAINSDDAEMGRRLNQEAAKAVKYGGMSEEDAWKMVTLNPAKLLHLDNRMGSLADGKDADIVIWSDNPLSIHAKPEYTIVDGAILFDAKRDLKLQERNQKERARIINEMSSENKKGGKKRLFEKRKKGLYHCDTIGEEASLEENHH